jgi:hypothetical protein
MERLGINRDTFFVGIAKLKEVGLYDFKARRGRRGGRSFRLTPD